MEAAAVGSREEGEGEFPAAAWGSPPTVVPGSWQMRGVCARIVCSHAARIPPAAVF